jgi:cytidine deaminase
MPRSKRLSAATTRRLLRSARAARLQAYCPYSGFAVGAALLCESGRTYNGVNVENSSYGATICAERSAILAAVSAGERDFAAMAVVAGGSPPIPCGQCLQVIAEFANPGMPLLLATPDLKSVKKFRLKDLLPETFVLPD